MAVGPPLRAQEQRRRIMPGVAALRQVVQVGDEDDPDAGLGQRADDLAGDLGALALVGGRERLVAQQQAAGRDLAGDGAHPVQFLVQLPLLHRGVFLALEVREDPGADAGGERLRRHEHPGLHHQLRQSDAAQERRLAALVRAGDHDQLLAVRVHVVPDGPGVVQAAAPGRRHTGRGRTGGMLLGAGRAGPAGPGSRPARRSPSAGPAGSGSRGRSPARRGASRRRPGCGPRTGPARWPRR